MALLVLIVVGVAVFCFYQGYWVVGFICLFGFSKKIGFVALIITAAFLIDKGHFVTGVLPVLLIAWNLVGLIGFGERGVTRTCIKLYHWAKRMRPGKDERDYLKLILLTKAPFDFSGDKYVERVLDTCPDIDSLAAFIWHIGRNRETWVMREMNRKERNLKERNEAFFREFWHGE